MCNFNNQNEEIKTTIHLFMKKSAQTLGGVNFLLSLIETMRETKPNPLLNSKMKIQSSHALIEWNKIVFKDKFDVLEELIYTHKSSDTSNFNILETPNHKKAKKILNMVKTLSPIEFIVTPKESNEFGGFSFKIFDKIEDGFVSLNPIFVAMFFCSIEFTKKALKHEI